MAVHEGSLETSRVLPDDATLEQVVQAPSSRPQSASLVLPPQPVQDVAGDLRHGTVVAVEAVRPFHGCRREDGPP